MHHSSDRRLAIPVCLRAFHYAVVHEHKRALTVLRAREAVEQCAVLLLRRKQLAQEDADYLPVPDHAAACLDGPSLRRVKELGNHNGPSLDAAHLADKVRVGAFASLRASITA